MHRDFVYVDVITRARIGLPGIRGPLQAALHSVKIAKQFRAGESQVVVAWNMWGYQAFGGPEGKGDFFVCYYPTEEEATIAGTAVAEALVKGHPPFPDFDKVLTSVERAARAWYFSWYPEFEQEDQGTFERVIQELAVSWAEADPDVRIGAIRQCELAIMQAQAALAVLRGGQWDLPGPGESCTDCPVGGRDGSYEPVCRFADACDRDCERQVDDMQVEETAAVEAPASVLGPEVLARLAEDRALAEPLKLRYPVGDPGDDDEGGELTEMAFWPKS